MDIDVVKVKKDLDTLRELSELNESGKNGLDEQKIQEINYKSIISKSCIKLKFSLIYMYYFCRLHP